jgi:DNA-binding MarR family transcriptional regulator
VDPPSLKNRRRDIAVALADGAWRTINEIAQSLGLKPANIFGLVRRMHADGLLEADSDPPTRGTQYRLTMSGSAAARQALEREEPVGRLTEQQTVMVIEPGGPEATLSHFDRVVSDPSVSGAVGWSAFFGWGWMLVFTPRTDLFQIKRLALRLDRAGYRTRFGRPEALISGATMREQALTLTEGM